MIMPIDIDKKEFSRDKRGYNSREVDEFLDLIVVDYEKVLNDNRSMAHKIKTLEKELEDAQKSDTAMVDTLETAKKLMADISASAERRAELMMRDAELESENILMDAKVSVKKLTDEHQILATKVERLRKNFKRMLEAELEDLEKDSYGLLVDMDVNDVLELDRKEEKEPAKTLVISDEPVEFSFNEEKKEEIVETESVVNDYSSDILDSSIFEEIKADEPTDLEHATISDLSESLKRMAEEETASINDTIILK